jgi:hypothetical protein
MLRSYVSFASRGEVVLRREIAGQLGVGPEGVLYGALCPAETSLVLSQLPPPFWFNAMKVIVHTHSRPGSMATVADAIAKLELSTISSWASTESLEGHLCFTSIVVPSRPEVQISADAISSRLSCQLGSATSDLAHFTNGELQLIRVTPLAILRAYANAMKESDYHRIEIAHHSLRLGASRSTHTNEGMCTLWEKLLTASEIPTASACILTPDTEESLLRICAVSENARLARIAFRVSIEADGPTSFAGYWTAALEELKAYKHSVFIAHNLLLAKTDAPHSETAEFHFVTDRRLSPDKGVPPADLGPIWEKRFLARLQSLACERGHTISGAHARVTRPRGVGVPCFVASNAKPGSGVGATTAVWVCRTLEGHGFKPVNIHVASGAPGLQQQVLDLVGACRFMIVLHCPEERLEDAATGLHGISDWVQFEEALMSRQGGEIIRMRFSNVRSPAYTPNYIMCEIPESGMEDRHKEEFVERLEQWFALMYEQYSENVYAADIPAKILDRDLVAYYGGRPQHAANESS